MGRCIVLNTAVTPQLAYQFLSKLTSVFNKIKGRPIYNGRSRYTVNRLTRVRKTTLCGAWLYIFCKLLKFDRHIKHTNIKLSSSIRNLYKIHKSLPMNTLKLLYHNLSWPYVLYETEALCTTNKTNINDIFIMHKKDTRVLSKIGDRHRTTNHFRAMDILKLDNLFKLQLST